MNDISNLSNSVAYSRKNRAVIKKKNNKYYMNFFCNCQLKNGNILN